MQRVQLAVDRFEDERSAIVQAYASALAEADSPLVATRSRWSRVRRQAYAVLRDCVAELRGQSPTFSEADWLSLEVMGARRALDGIPFQESIHAARLLWGAMLPAFGRAVAGEPEADRNELLSAAGTAFLRSSAARLRAGASGYADSGLIEHLLRTELQTDRIRLGLPVQRRPDPRVPAHGAHQRIAAALGVPESHVRDTLRAALRASAEAEQTRTRRTTPPEGGVSP